MLLMTNNLCVASILISVCKNDFQQLIINGEYVGFWIVGTVITDKMFLNHDSMLFQSISFR